MGWKVAAVAAWGGVVLGSALPARALCLTSQTGQYAACSANYYADAGDQLCTMMHTSYRQTIKFVSTPCSSGGCSNDMDTVYTDMVYPPGRKATTLYSTCGATYTLYGLGSCAC